MEWLMNFLQSISPQGPVGVPPQQLPPTVPQTPAPAPAPATPAPAATPVPGSQVIPRPTARPADVMLSALFGPSVAPSQEGVWHSPSQGPGEAVTQPDPAVVKPKVSDALQMPQSNNSTSAPAAPSVPAPNRMAAGQLQALLGGQNPLAAQQAPVLELLSRLLGGR